MTEIYPPDFKVKVFGKLGTRVEGWIEGLLIEIFDSNESDLWSLWHDMEHNERKMEELEELAKNNLVIVLNQDGDISGYLVFDSVGRLREAGEVV